MASAAADAAPEPTEEPAPASAPTVENTPSAVEEAESEPLSKIDAIIASFADPPQTNRDVVILYGQVLDVSGTPLEGVAVEIWRTDANGVYDHPGDPSTAGQDWTRCRSPFRALSSFRVFRDSSPRGLRIIVAGPHFQQDAFPNAFANVLRTLVGYTVIKDE